MWLHVCEKDTLYPELDDLFCLSDGPDIWKVAPYFRIVHSTNARSNIISPYDRSLSDK